MMKKSLEESKISSLNIFNYQEKNIDKNLLIDSMLVNQADVVKLSLDSNNNKMFEILDEINMPYQVQYVGIKTEMNLENPILQEELSKNTTYDFQYKVYDSKQHRDILNSLVKDCMNEIVTSFYNDAILETYLNKQKNLELQAAYVSTFDYNIDKNKLGLIGFNENNEPIGFFLLELHHPKAIAYMGGVLPKYRKNSIAYKGYSRVINDYLLPKKFTSLQMNVQAQNIANIRASLLKGKGLLPKSSFTKINLYPFFYKLFNEENKTTSFFQLDDLVKNNYHLRHINSLKLPNKAKKNNYYFEKKLSNDTLIVIYYNSKINIVFYCTYEKFESPIV